MSIPSSLESKTLYAVSTGSGHCEGGQKMKAAVLPALHNISMDNPNEADMNRYICWTTATLLIVAFWNSGWPLQPVHWIHQPFSSIREAPELHQFMLLLWVQMLINSRRQQSRLFAENHPAVWGNRGSTLAISHGLRFLRGALGSCNDCFSASVHNLESHHFAGMENAGLFRLGSHWGFREDPEQWLPRFTSCIEAQQSEHLLMTIILAQIQKYFIKWKGFYFKHAFRVVIYLEPTNQSLIKILVWIHSRFVLYIIERGYVKRCIDDPYHIIQSLFNLNYKFSDLRQCDYRF